MLCGYPIRLARRLSLDRIFQIAFAHLLPNFVECWWDALVLDVLLCNGLGIWVGLRLCKMLEMREYKWVSIRSVQCFTSLTVFELKAIGYEEVYNLAQSQQMVVEVMLTILIFPQVLKTKRNNLMPRIVQNR